MGKTTGFLEYKRTDLPDRDPLKRIIDWNEIHLPLDLDEPAPAGRALHGLRRTILPQRRDDERHDDRLSAA